MLAFDQTMKSSLLGGDVSYNDLRKTAFHAAGKRLMKRIAKLLNLTSADFALRSDLGGIAVSGEITLHTDRLYLQLSQGALFGGRTEILYRACNGRKDYAGHRNHFVTVEALIDAQAAERFIHHLKNLSEPLSGSAMDVRMAA